MIIYEVNLNISLNVYNKFDLWLNKHIEKMLSHKGFIECKRYTIKSDDIKNKNICLHYYIEDENSLQDYLDNYSKIMQKSAVLIFGKQFSANRRILLK